MVFIGSKSLLNDYQKHLAFKVKETRIHTFDFGKSLLVVKVRDLFYKLRLLFFSFGSSPCI